MVAQMPLWELCGLVAQKCLIHLAPCLFLVIEPLFPCLWNVIQSQPIAEWIHSANSCGKLVNECEHCDLLLGSEPSLHCDSSLPPHLHGPWSISIASQLPRFLPTRGLLSLNLLDLTSEWNAPTLVYCVWKGKHFGNLGISMWTALLRQSLSCHGAWVKVLRLAVLFHFKLYCSGEL